MNIIPQKNSNINIANFQKLFQFISGHQENNLNEKGESPCWGFVVVYESTIRYERYGITASFPDDGDNAVVKPLIGDVAFEFQYYNTAYVKEEMSLRVIFLLYTTALIIVYWLKMRPFPISSWLAEQKSLFFLLIGLVCLNSSFFF